jgi:hypothetical protein
MLKRLKFKQFASKAILLSALLATGATVIAQSASSVTLELFNAKPSESSQATASLEIGSSGGNLQGIETPEKAGKARYLRAKVATASGVENFVYRVIGNPNNGRIFIITPERKAITLNKFLASTGLEVGKDKTVKLGSQVDFASTNATVMKSGSSGTSMVAGSSNEASTTSTTASTAPVEETTTPASSTSATDSSTAGSTPADASATTPATTTPAADSSTAAPTDPSTAATTEASTTPATTATPDASTTPATSATPDASATTTGSSTTPATDANAMPATPAADATAAAPATDANAAAPASSTANTEAAALTAPVSTTVGKVELTVIPAGATAPASSEKNLILAPVADATEAKSSVEGNTVTLSYTSSSSIDDVSRFYDDQLKAQGFTPDLADPTNQKGADQFVKVYKRGTASMTVSVKNENGAYQVEVDLESLANGN